MNTLLNIENKLGRKRTSKKELLGHSRPETTMIYTHVTRKDLEQIKSPLDTAINKLSLQGSDNEKISIS